jgi:RimJ/RimL family protein N-acetyltransferase
VTETPRLGLRPWTTGADDLAFLYDMYARTEVRRYIGDGRVMTDPAEAVALVNRWAGLADGVLGVRAVETRAGERLGSILLKPIPWSAHTPQAEAGAARDIEIGWHFHPAAWGHGYAAEAASTVLDEAWAAGIARVVAVTHPDNAASQRVCRRIGMTHLGRSDRYYDAECEVFEVLRG